MTNEGIAREILDANSYVVLATADADGVPWASPVYRACVIQSWILGPDSPFDVRVGGRP